MVPIISLNLYIFIDHTFMIGFGAHHGYVGILLTIGDIGQVGGVHTIA